MKRRAFIIGTTIAAAMAPLLVRAQPARRTPLVGVLWHAGSAEEEGAYYTALIEGFRALGYIDGQTIRLEQRFPNETPDLFRSMAAELVALNPDVLVSVGTTTARYLPPATSTIPIVFTVVADPLALKLVDSLARPGRNVTGLSTFSSDLTGKRLALLKQVVPELRHVGLLINPDEGSAPLYVEEAEHASAALGVRMTKFEVLDGSAYDATFASMANADVQAVVVPGGSRNFQNRAHIAELAVARRLPMAGWNRESVEDGFLVSYGTDVRDVVRRAATYVDKILKGAKPAELPVEQPTKFEMLVNLKTATALGLTMPSSLLHLADDVIE